MRFPNVSNCYWCVVLVGPGRWQQRAEEVLALAPGQRGKVLQEELECACLHGASG
jgi:hypothetical protein